VNPTRNRLFVTLGSIAAVFVLLGAFTVVWLMPRGPQPTEAGGIGNTGSTVGSNSSVAGNDKALSQAAPASQSSVVTGDTPRISVRGTGIVSAQPDMATLQVGVQVQNSSLESAQSEANDKMDAIMNQLKSAGIEDKDISTAQYSVEPVMQYAENQPPTVTGFRVTNILNVKIRDISKTGSVLDSLVKPGANTIYGLSFGFADPAALTRQAREQAVNDAKSRADHLASLNGVALGAPIVIDETGGVPPVPMAVANPAELAQRDAATVAIQPGAQEIRVDVSVVYAISK
jgi:uncharacterized protein